jgi:DNA repair protein RadC
VRPQVPRHKSPRVDDPALLQTLCRETVESSRRAPGRRGLSQNEAWPESPSGLLEVLSADAGGLIEAAVACPLIPAFGFVLRAAASLPFVGLRSLHSAPRGKPAARAVGLAFLAPPGGYPPKTQPTVPVEPAALPRRRPTTGKEATVKDNETISLEQHDQAGTVAPGSGSSIPSLDSDANLADPTAKLVADVLGSSLKRSGSILQALGGLSGLAHASEEELCAAAISRSKAKLVCAAFELARQSIGQPLRRGARLPGATEVWQHMRARLSGRPVEEFWAIALDVRHRVLADLMLARGSLTGVEIHPRDVFRPLIKLGAAAVLFCHNHPSGDPSPSRADVELTTRLREVGDVCGIPVLDHVVVGFDGYSSLAERGWR